MKKIIFLIDMNTFYVTCELLRKPEYKKKPIIIAGEGKRSVVCAASYVAKEQGIDSAMPLRDARRINPNVILVEPDFPHYRAQSQRIMAFLKQFDPQAAQSSIDEAYLDVSHYFVGRHVKRADIFKLAHFIQGKLFKQLGFPCNVGISTNKFLAKMASELDKPFKVASIFVSEVEEKMWPQRIGKMFGIGQKTASVLEHIHIKTIGDFATFENEKLLQNLFGPRILQKQQYARGIVDSEQEVVEERAERKSISHSRTFMEDQSAEKVIIEKLAELWQAVVTDLEKKQLKIRSLRVFYKQSDFHTVQRSITFEDYRADWKHVYETAQEMLYRLWEGEPIRLLGIGVGEFIARANHAQQLDLFATDWTRVPKQIQAARRQSAVAFVADHVPDAKLATAQSLLAEQEKLRKD